MAKYEMTGCNTKPAMLDINIKFVSQSSRFVSQTVEDCSGSQSQSCVTASQVLFATAGCAGPGVCRSRLLFIFVGVTNVGGVEGLVVSDHKRTSRWVPTHSVNGATSVKPGPLQIFGIANREVTEDADTRGAMG